MQSFFNKIRLEDTLLDLFLSPLLKDKHKVPNLDAENKKLVLDISRSFFISGFILRSCHFSKRHKDLVEQLKVQRKAQLFKQMAVKNDLNNIARSLNKKGLKHVFLKGVALNEDGIYLSGIRFSRDIDLLVRLDSLDEAYDALKLLGFRYLNSKTRDSTKYHHYGHHLPEMINENNTKLELHWRVTSSNQFKNCPITDKMLDSMRASNIHSHIFCPPIEATIAHIIYHSFVQHRMNLGPIFLFDLAAIFVFFGKKWPVDQDLLKSLGIEKKFELSKKLIERAMNEPRFSDQSKLLREQIFKNSHWLRLSDGSTISESSKKTTRIEIFDKPNFLSRLTVKFRNVSALYQVSYFSPKFWVVLVSDILVFLKRVMREFSN